MLLDAMLENLTRSGEITFDTVMDYDRALARSHWATVRADHNLAPNGRVPLLGEPTANVKVARNEAPTWTLTLAPARTSGHNVCQRSTKACRAACVMWTAWRGQFDRVRVARIARTALLAEHPVAFLALLTDELAAIAARGESWGVRLNTASDIRWERWDWLFMHYGMRAYDYTKYRFEERGPLPANYRLTYSASEQWTDDQVRGYLLAKRNVAMVFDCAKHELPDTYLGFTVIDGDVSDWRYGDLDGVIVGLAAKGAAKQLQSADTSVFVRSA